MEFAKTSLPDIGKRRALTSLRTLLAFAFALVFSATSLAGCGTEAGDAQLTQKTYMELVDWHVAGLWVINSPVAWIRVMNYNNVPIKDVTFNYYTYDYQGKELNHGEFTCEGVVQPGGMKNFIELYLGCVDVNSQQLQVKLTSVKAAGEH